MQQATLYVGGENRWAHLWTTADRGKSWTAVASPSEYEFRSVVPDPEEPFTLYGVESTRGILKSNDGGKTWRVLRSEGGSIVGSRPRRSAAGSAHTVARAADDHWDLRGQAACLIATRSECCRCRRATRSIIET